MTVVNARIASSGDCLDKQRENIPSSPPPPSTTANSVGTGSLERAGSLDGIGKEISELRRERAAIGLQDSASTTGFWKGVAEETSLIDWPVFSKVLGTTGVVVAMILGSSVVLLTVNALLAASSDFIFNDPAIRELVKPQ